MRRYTAFMKEHRELIQFGTFYRLSSPFEENESAWMVVDDERKKALIGYYITMARVNAPFKRLRLSGLDPDRLYEVKGFGTYYGDELMNTGLVTTPLNEKPGRSFAPAGDFTAHVIELCEV